LASFVLQVLWECTDVLQLLWGCTDGASELMSRASQLAPKLDEVRRPKKTPC